ncbi:MAG: hypothetical protein IPL47_17110 [Phyllobacteriaceae bacterium]|nr:hypothetical protein [Phyllobacteriaceae bacterium]
MNTALKPVWAGAAMRLDPFRLPQAVTYAGRDDQGEVDIMVDHRGARLRRTLAKSGLDVSLVLPFRAFAGVAARAIEDDFGNVTATLELHHADPQLCVPLLVAENLDDIAADWRGWAKAAQLPMLLVEADGVARPLDSAIGKVRATTPIERRKGRAAPKRRARFLARRRGGDLGLRLVVSGEEIIARD